MGRQSAYSFDDEIQFIRGLGTWSKDPAKHPRRVLVAGYIRGVKRRSVGFDKDGPLTMEQLRRINDEVLVLCRRLGLPAAIEFVVTATTH